MHVWWNSIMLLFGTFYLYILVYIGMIDLCLSLDYFLFTGTNILLTMSPKFLTSSFHMFYDLPLFSWQ